MATAHTTTQTDRIPPLAVAAGARERAQADAAETMAEADRRFLVALRLHQGAGKSYREMEAELTAAGYPLDHTRIWQLLNRAASSRSARTDCVGATPAGVGETGADKERS